MLNMSNLEVAVQSGVTMVQDLNKIATAAFLKTDKHLIFPRLLAILSRQWTCVCSNRKWNLWDMKWRRRGRACFRSICRFPVAAAFLSGSEVKEKPFRMQKALKSLWMSCQPLIILWFYSRQNKHKVLLTIWINLLRVITFRISLESESGFFVDTYEENKKKHR